MYGNNYPQLSAPPGQNWIRIGVPILCIIGFFMHNLYEWSGSNLIVGIFAPVNESVWEHLKMTFWPILFWWSIGYIFLQKNQRFSPAQWFVACTVAELTCLLFIPSFYYTYTGALGIKSVVLDVISLFLGVILGQFLALRIYNRTECRPYSLIAAISLLLALSLAFVLFTFAPPHIPLFQDSTTGNYGI
jgi:hypothetical protein